MQGGAAVGKRQQPTYRFYLLFAAAIMVIACFFPPSADDLGWATTRGLTVFQAGFDNYNGRYLGNLFAFALVRIPGLLPLIKGLTLSGILALMQKLCNNQDRNFLYLSAALLIIPTPLWMQGFIWTAGFSNYTLSLLVILAGIYFVICRREVRGFRAVLCGIAIVILGVSGQLFMETFTLFTLVFSFGCVLYFSAKRHKADLRSILYFLSCIIGAVIMFSNTAYVRIWQGDTSYQQITGDRSSPIGLVYSALQGLFGIVSLQTMLACIPALALLTWFSVRLLNKNPNAGRGLRRTVWILYLGVPVLFIAYAVCYLLQYTTGVAQFLPGFAVLVWIMASAIVVKQSFAPARQRQLLLYLLLLLLLTAPLSVVYPIGPRCFTGTMLLLILVSKAYWDELQEALPVEKHKGVSKAPRHLLIALLVCNLLCYSLVTFFNQQKLHTIRTAVEAGKTEVTLQHTKLGFMVYALDVEDKSENYRRRFCEYYDLPLDFVIHYE